MYSTFTGSFSFGKRYSAPPPPPPPPPSATAVLELDAANYSGSGNWLDETANGNDASLQGTPAYVSNTHFDLVPGEGDFFSITDDRTLDSMTEFSVQMWINIDTINASGPNMLYSKRSTTSNGYVGFFATTGWTFRLGTGTGTGLTYNTAPSTGSWQQIVATIGSSGSKFYINGSEVANSVYTGNTTNIQTVGAALDLFNVNPRPQTGPVTMDGKVGIVKIYDGVLTSSQVSDEFNTYKTRYGL